MMNIFTRYILLLAAFSAVRAITAITDKATGISFAPKKHGLEIFGVGVRKKGPIKIYSVAFYGGSHLKKKLSEIKRSNEKAALSALQSGAKSEHSLFLVQMSMKVGAEKMASAIADSVAPRHKGNKKDVEDLKEIIVQGCDGAAVKGTTLEFECTGKAVDVSVNGKAKGSVSSAPLSSAFCDVYLDNKCVSPPLRNSILNECCQP